MKVWASQKIVLRPDTGYSKYHLVHNVETLYPYTGTVHVLEFSCEHLEKRCVHVSVQRES